MTCFYIYFRYHTLPRTFLRGVGTKTHLYDILKLHTQHGGNQNVVQILS